MKSLFKFYLKNFRAIHHIVFIVMTFLVLKLISYIFNPLSLIFEMNTLGVILQLITLGFCYYFNEKALGKSGLTDEFMNNELENFNQKKR